jgi:hypothetical protein
MTLGEGPTIEPYFYSLHIKLRIFQLVLKIRIGENSDTKRNPWRHGWYVAPNDESVREILLATSTYLLPSLFFVFMVYFGSH